MGIINKSFRLDDFRLNQVIDELIRSNNELRERIAEAEAKLTANFGDPSKVLYNDDDVVVYCDGAPVEVDSWP